MRSPTRTFCHSLIDGFAGRDEVDAATEYGMHIPIRVIADMLGFPPEDAQRFKGFVEDALEGINMPLEEREQRELQGRMERKQMKDFMNVRARRNAYHRRC